MSKVVVIKCTGYDPETVYQALKRGLDALGSITRFVSPAEKILLKPNLLRGRSPEAACTTHPAVFEGVIRLLKEAGCGQLTYGDSPGVGAPEKAVRECGLDEVAQRYEVPLSVFSNGKTVPYPEGKITKQFELAHGVIESDAMISLCKMKTHGLTRITGAVKNQLGCVYGFNKGTSHARFPDARQFSRMLVDLNMLLKPRLYIMDGIVAMEGNGPASGTPVAMNCLLISDDPVALDATFARLVAVDPAYVPTIVAGQEGGLGSYTDIEYLGDDPETLINRDFVVDRAKTKDDTLVSIGLSRLQYVKNLLTRKPVLIPERCIGCGVCIQACPLPEKAIGWHPGGGRRRPKYDYRKCIRCYCCQEMCPQKAIEVKTPLIGKWLIYRD